MFGTSTIRYYPGLYSVPLRGFRIKSAKPRRNLAVDQAMVSFASKHFSSCPLRTPKEPLIINNIDILHVDVPQRKVTMGVHRKAVKRRRSK
jgi:hypothetical protein